MKEKGTKHWQAPNTGASNSSGFTSLPGGARERTYTYPTIVTFHNFGYLANFWTSEAAPISNDAFGEYLRYDNTWLSAGNAFDTNSGFSVRLVED